MCILIASIMLFAVLTPTVAALPLYGRATIWGSESRDAWNSTLNLSWRKHPNEVTRQVATSAFIRSEFNQNGYYASDYQGSKGSNKDSILAQIGSNQLNYPRVAVVDFDHGNGNTGVIPEAPNEFHYMFEDQRGTFSGSVCHPPPADHPEYGVYDYEIYPNTNLGKYFFVLINACNSAHVNTTFFGYYPSTQGIIPGTNRARGMPYAWTHRLVQNRDTYPGFNTSDHMSDDGYARPDNGDFVYLGFYLGSAALTQDVDGFNGPRPYWLWLEHFISYAVRNNWSVKQALNQASLDFYGANFGQIPLHTSYTAIWPMFYSDWPGGQPYWHNGSGQQGPGSRMMVYGNSNIKLYQPLLTLSASGGLSPTFTIDGQPYGTGSHRLISDTYTVNVNDISGYQFNYFIYNGGYYSRPASLQIAQDRTITAHYTLLPYINILPDTGGYTIPPAGYYPGSGSMQIQAIASAGYYFVEWRLNGEYLSSNPTVYVDYGANTVEPVFAMDDPEYADLTITAWECMYYTEVEVQIDCDGEYFCTTPIYNDDSLYTGWYTFSNSQYECLYISVTAGGGQYYEYGNSVYLYLDTSPVIIDFYFY